MPVRDICVSSVTNRLVLPLLFYFIAQARAALRYMYEVYMYILFSFVQLMVAARPVTLVSSPNSPLRELAFSPPLRPVPSTRAPHSRVSLSLSSSSLLLLLLLPPLDCKQETRSR